MPSSGERLGRSGRKRRTPHDTRALRSQNGRTAPILKQKSAELPALAMLAPCSCAASAASSGRSACSCPSLRPAASADEPAGSRLTPDVLSPGPEAAVAGARRALREPTGTWWRCCASRPPRPDSPADLGGRAWLARPGARAPDGLGLGQLPAGLRSRAARNRRGRVCLFLQVSPFWELELTPGPGAGRTGLHPSWRPTLPTSDPRCPAGRRAAARHRDRRPGPARGRAGADPLRRGARPGRPSTASPTPRPGCGSPWTATGTGCAACCADSPRVEVHAGPPAQGSSVRAARCRATRRGCAGARLGARPAKAAAASLFTLARSRSKVPRRCSSSPSRVTLQPRGRRRRGARRGSRAREPGVVRITARGSRGARAPRATRCS